MRVLPSPADASPTTVNEAIDDSLGFSLLVYDHELTFLAAAGGALRENGVDPAEWIGARADEIMPDWAWARLEEPYRAALAGRTSTTLVSTPDGATWFSTTIQPIPGEPAKAVSISTTVAGATEVVQWPELPQLTDALAEVAGLGDNAFFEVAFAAAPVGMAVVDFTGRWLRVNAALATFLGRSEPELRGTNFGELTDEAIDGSEIAKLISGELPRIETERRYRHKDGHWVTAQLSVCVARDTNGAAQVFIAQMVDITAQKAHEAELERLASRDPLTGLANRRSIEQAIAARVEAGSGAALLIDLDGFKFTNDGFGHSAGDAILQAVANRLRDCTSAGEVVGRIGGDEFVVVLPDATADEALQLAGELCEWLATTHVTLDGSTTIFPAASIGAAAIDESTAEVSSVLLAADIAMYDAKQRGGNQAVIYGGELAAHHRASNDLEWLAQLRRALTEHHFELHAQAIVDLQTGEPVKYELLLRLRGDDGQLIPPGAFMPAAERLKLMRDLDEWVVAEASAIAAEYPGVQLGINLSGSSVGDPSLPRRIEDIIFATQCDPTQLVFEITETEAIANMEQAKKLVDHISSLGCTFALDDFGAGYASFSHLKRLAIEFVKIDGQFVRDLPSTPEDKLIVSAIHHVAAGMGRKVVAEMIEDEATAELLKEIGVEYGQGWFYARPAPVDDVLTAAKMKSGSPGSSGFAPDPS